MSYLALIKKAEEDLKAKRETLESQEPDRPLTDDDTPGVTAADVLRVFDGGLVIEEDKPFTCRHCNEKKGVLYRSGWRKGGKIIRRTRADGVYVWACHFCGREARGKTVCQMNGGPEMGGNGLRNIPFLLRRPVRERVLAT